MEKISLNSHLSCDRMSPYLTVTYFVDMYMENGHWTSLL